MRSGSVTDNVESRMFCERLAVELSESPMLENVVLHDTDDVRVDCDSVWGLYSELRLLRS